MFAAIFNEINKSYRLVRIPAEGLVLRKGEVVVETGTWQQCRDAARKPPVFVESIYDGMMNWEQLKETLV